MILSPEYIFEDFIEKFNPCGTSIILCQNHFLINIIEIDKRGTHHCEVNTFGDKSN